MKTTRASLIFGIVRWLWASKTQYESQELCKCNLFNSDSETFNSLHGCCCIVSILRNRI